MDRVLLATPLILGPLPERSLMTVRELLNWRAFGEATTLDRTERDAFLRMWECGPEAENGGCALEFVVQEYAGTLSEQDRGLLRLAENVPIWLLKERERVKRIANRVAQPVSELDSILRAMLDGWRERTACLLRAEAEVLDKLAGGFISVIATPSEGGHAIFVDLTYFATDGVRLGLDDSITAPGAASFVNGRFHTAEVSTVWPLQTLNEDRGASSSLAQPATSNRLDYRAADAPLVRQMQELIANGMGVWEAADQLATRAAGKPGTTHNSKTARLLKRWKESNRKLSSYA